MVFRRSFLAALALLAASTRPAAAQTFTYNGPFTGTGATANPWSTDTWIGGTPTSGATTQLVFSNYDANAYSANNNLGNPFLLGAVVFNSFSTSSTTVSSAAGSSLELTGASPTITQNGSGAITFGTGGNGLVLAPTSGTTTVQGSGNGVVTMGNNTITGSGGLAISLTGAGGVSLFGNNTFTGGVTLNGGTLYVGAANALGVGNTLTINGGNLRALIATTFSNAVVLNSNLNFLAGTMTLNGPVSGAGGVNVTNGTNFAAQNLTFGGALTFGGPLTIQNSVPRPSGASGNLATVTLAAGATLGSAQPITVGNDGTLVIAGNSATSHLPNANALVLNGGHVSLAGSSGTGSATRETFGNVTASGLAVITNTGGANTSTLAFGTLTRQNNATLNFFGPLNGSNNTVTFAGGLATVSDPLAPATTGVYTGIIPYAAGNFTAGQANVNEFLTYNGTGVSFINPTDTTSVQQVSGAITAANAYANVNLTGTSTTVNGTQRINSLSNTTSSTVTGTGTLTVSSGGVLVASNVASGGQSLVGLAFSGPTLDFGAATGYIHLGGNGIVQGTSTITGSGGLVISGLDAPGSSAPGSGAGFTFQFSSTNVANPFTGGLTINGNVGVGFTADAQLGAAGGALTFGGGALTFNPAGTNSVTVNRPIILGPAGGDLVMNSTGTFTVAGPIPGSGALGIGSAYYANNGSPVVLSGANTYTGPTYVETGAVLNVANDANMGSVSAPVNMQGGTLQFSAPNTFNKPVVFSSGSTFDTQGNAVTLAGALSGVVPAGFNKIGAGSLTLSAASPLFTGAVNVNAGTLALTATGSLPQITTLTVNTGGTLAGNGSVGGSVKVVSGGTFAPGINGPGQFTVGGNLSLATGSTAVMELGGTTAGTGYDQGIVFNALTLGGNLSLNLVSGYVPTLGQKFFLFDLTGLNAAAGTFANGTGTGTLLFADNAGNTYQVNYADHDPADGSNALANDVSLTVVALVPEPSTWALFGGGALTALAALARRRHRRAA